LHHIKCQNPPFYSYRNLLHSSSHPYWFVCNILSASHSRAILRRLNYLCSWICECRSFHVHLCKFVRNIYHFQILYYHNQKYHRWSLMVPLSFLKNLQVSRFLASSMCRMQDYFGLLRDSILKSLWFFILVCLNH